jgi:hypothetical protein
MRSGDICDYALSRDGKYPMTPKIDASLLKRRISLFPDI